MKYKEFLPVVRFLISAAGLYILWYVVYESWLHPQGKTDVLVINNTIAACQWLLGKFGYGVFTADRTIGIDGTGGAWIGDSCNGMSLFVLYAGFILCYPGKISLKLIFIPAGILSIHILNIFRVAALLLLQLHFPSSLDFNHKYTFTFLMYAYIFLLWMWFVRRNGKMNKIKEVS